MWIIFLKGYCVLVRVEIIHKSKFLPGTVEKNSSTIRSESESEKLYLIRVTHSVCNILLSFGALGLVRAVHRHRTGVGSIPAGGPYS